MISVAQKYYLKEVLGISSLAFSASQKKMIFEKPRAQSGGSSLEVEIDGNLQSGVAVLISTRLSDGEKSLAEKILAAVKVQNPLWVVSHEALESVVEKLSSETSVKKIIYFSEKTQGLGGVIETQNIQTLLTHSLQSMLQGEASVVQDTKKQVWSQLQSFFKVSRS